MPLRKRRAHVLDHIIAGLKKVHWTADGRHVPPPSVTTLSVRERALQALATLPPFSPILNRVIASLGQQDPSFSAVSELIEKDTVLAGNVLQLVNSALYGTRRTVTSVRHAVSLLGINKLRNATLGMSVARMWNQVKTPPGWSMASFNLHSAGVAILSDLLSQRLPVDYAEGAFAAGLFHDLGWLLVVLGSPDEFKRLSGMREENEPSKSASESDLFGVTHAELSAEALAIWNLPDPIQTAVRYHSTPDEDPCAGGNRIPLSRIVNVADQSVRRIGCSLSMIENDSEVSDDVPGSLGEQLAQVLPEFESEFANIQPYF